MGSGFHYPRGTSINGNLGLLSLWYSVPSCNSNVSHRYIITNTIEHINCLIQRNRNKLRMYLIHAIIILILHFLSRIHFESYITIYHYYYSWYFLFHHSVIHENDFAPILEKLSFRVISFFKNPNRRFIFSFSPSCIIPPMR